jgi:hypothetical protein
MAPKRRRLSDLYVVGKEATINDNTGEEPVVVWIQKLNPLDNDNALRRAAAARARYLAYRKEPDSDEYRAALSDVTDFATRDTLIDMVARDEILVRRMRVEAEMGAEDEWSKDDYLQGLHDAWEGNPDSPGLKERYAIERDDPEAKRVLEELGRFNKQVDQRMEGEREEVRRDYEHKTDDDLTSIAVERIIESRATTQFMREYENEMLLAAVRELEDHKKRYFIDRAEVDGLDQKVHRQLLEHLQMVTVERDEGKGSRGIPASSLPSEPSETVETEPSSGLATAAP